MKRLSPLIIFVLSLAAFVGEPARATWRIDYQPTVQSPYVGPHEGVKLLWYKPWTGYGKQTMDSQSNINHNLSSQRG